MDEMRSRPRATTDKDDGRRGSLRSPEIGYDQAMLCFTSKAACMLRVSDSSEKHVCLVALTTRREMRTTFEAAELVSCGVHRLNAR